MSIAKPASFGADALVTSSSRQDASARSRRSLPGLWGHVRPVLLVVLPGLFALLAIAFVVQAWRGAQANRTIADLGTGRDVAVAAGAPAPVLLARLQFLAERDRVDEAEALIGPIEQQGDSAILSRARYAMANARLRQAFGHLTRGNIDPAGPLVTLARYDYRRALQAKPDFWDAKFNFDVASRLIRDFPDFDRKHGDELQAAPKKIWTDIPGQPRGAP